MAKKRPKKRTTRCTVHQPGRYTFTSKRSANAFVQEAVEAGVNVRLVPGDGYWYVDLS